MPARHNTMMSISKALLIIVSSILFTLLVCILVAPHPGVLPRISSFYDAAGLDWIGQIRVTFGFIATAALAVASAFILTTVTWDSKRSKLIGVAGAVMMCTTATNILAITMMVVSGGTWHAMAAFTSIIEAVATTVGACVFAWGYLQPNTPR